MQVILAAPRGFCAGVNMAVETLEAAVKKYGTPLFVYHEIVHNTWVVNDFREKGVTFVDSLDDVPDGACLMYSAHGVSPEIRKQSQARNLRIIDATCPLVARVHRQARQLVAQGYTILLIGHAGHDEIVGVRGEAPDAIHVLCSREEAEKVDIGPVQRVAYLTQTTLSTEEAADIVSVLKMRFPEIHEPLPSCICFATQNRQRAIQELSPRADAVVVVGSPNSSNSRRLKEMAERHGVPAYLIDGVGELRPEWLEKVGCLLITAGASAPERVVQEVVRFLVETYHAEISTVETCRETLEFRLPTDTNRI
ncbi:MAG: 4-hydroxy-3-methylbut-2-enyl diphosphate reductase [Planctomycetia bacterium]|nr:4-hydroxy-3-methylbut-2-enyl diphosphate reductase [Planctomycetia bacterium]